MHFNQAKFYCDLNIVNLSNFVLVIVTKVWKFCLNNLEKSKTFNFKKIIVTKIKKHA